MSESTETVTEPRLMSKVFNVERTEKGSGLQSKINAWTNGKNIGEVHDLTVKSENGATKAVVLYEEMPGDAAKADRLFAKVVENKEFGNTALSTAVNSWSKGKSGEIKYVATAVDSDGNALVVILHKKDASDVAETE